MVPSLERTRELYGRLYQLALTSPDTDKCSWHNLYDRVTRIHLPDRLRKKADLTAAKGLLGQRAFTVVAILALARYNYRYRHYSLIDLCFESAIRAARTGPLDLEELVPDWNASEDPPETDLFATPLKPVPDIHDIRGLIPETQWAPVSAEPGQQHGWSSVMDNARRLGRDALNIDDETWTRLEARIEPRGAAAAVLYAAPRPPLGPEPGVIARIVDLRTEYDSSWYLSSHAKALSAIEAEIDLAIVAALENCTHHPASLEYLLPRPDLLNEHGPKAFRKHFPNLGAEDAEWDRFATLAHDLATGALQISKKDWERACRILGLHRAAAAMLATAAIHEERARRDFGSIVFHEATRPGSLPSLLRSKRIPYQSGYEFTRWVSFSIEPNP